MVGEQPIIKRRVHPPDVVGILRQIFREVADRICLVYNFRNIACHRPFDSVHVAKTPPRDSFETAHVAARPTLKIEHPEKASIAVAYRLCPKDRGGNYP